MGRMMLAVRLQGTVGIVIGKGSSSFAGMIAMAVMREASMMAAECCYIAVVGVVGSDEAAVGSMIVEVVEDKVFVDSGSALLERLGSPSSIRQLPCCLLWSSENVS
jgi:hypothetical protein